MWPHHLPQSRPYHSTLPLQCRSYYVIIHILAFSILLYLLHFLFKVPFFSSRILLCFTRFLELLNSLALLIFYFSSLAYQTLFISILFKKFCKENFYKVINKHCRAFNPFNSQFSILHQFIYIVVHNIDILCLILAFKVFCQNKAYFIVTKYFHLFDYIFC